MNRIERLEQEVETLRDRLARLTEASHRINDSLDFESVLQGVLDSARLLTKAKFGVITLINETGEIQDFLASGMTQEESQNMWDWQEGIGLFDYLGKIRKPLRLNDFHSHTRALGLPDFQPPMSVHSPLPFLAAPIRHHREIVGNFFLGEKDKENGLFTTDDEETLVAFASQAGLVIANARRHQDEQKARARLETLIDTSPVGVVVLNVSTGEAVTFNREAARIIDALRTPDKTVQQLLGLITIRRADGREISLQEFPVAQMLRAGETIRAEEIEIRVPGGNSVRTLVNATPIHLEQDSEVDSFVVTMQDMAALEEIERLRSDFSAMISHELRVPLASIKGSAATVLTAPTTFGPTEMVQFFRIIDREADHMSALINDLLDVAHIEAGTLSISPEPVGITEMIENARSTFLSGGDRNSLQIDIQPDLPPVMADKRRIVQVLGNLLSNAAKHSPHSSAIRVSAVRLGVHVSVTVADDGAGLSKEILPHLFRKIPPGSGDHGQGLGLTICKGIVEEHGGRIWAESDGPGNGALFTFTLPAANEGSSFAPTTLTDHASATQTVSSRDQNRILVIDDDPKSLRYVRDILSNSGYQPVVTAEPKEALRLVSDKKPALILLDLMLPGSSGIDLMTDILSVANVPIVFLSAYGQEDVVARAFDMGAADYVVKPFSKTELLARIRAALRHQEVVTPSTPYRRADLAIDYVSRTVTLAGSPVRLTAMEYRLLTHLSANDGRTLTHDHLLQHVWGLPASLDLRPLRTAIKTLRRKLGDSSADPTYIFTEPRVGYSMERGDGPPLSSH